MNTTTTDKKASLNPSNLFLLVVLFLLSCTSVNAQTVSNDETAKVKTSTVEMSLATNDTQIDFVGWFMGSNQNQSIIEGALYNDKNTSTKKQIISSGIVPNRVLYKTLVKKVFVNAIV